MRVVRIFLSTPNDVPSERTQVQQLVRDINETVQFLAPSQEVRFEVVSYDTHVYPDVAGHAAQAVIDTQLSVDFDLYLGIMWKRAGTPTSEAPSGTIHEFEQALRHRMTHGWPVIFFFFCDESIEFPSSAEELEQLKRVLDFRARAASLGLTVNYATHGEFRDALRTKLLRGLADILSPSNQERRTTAEAEPEVPPAAERELRDLARQYDDVRIRMPSGHERTRAMTAIFNAMVELASATRPLLPQLQASNSEGERLAAIGILHAFPSADELTWLADRLDNPATEKPFVGYQAAVALGQAARTLPQSDLPGVAAALAHALQLARRLPQDADRIRALEYAANEAARRRR